MKWLEPLFDSMSKLLPFLLAVAAILAALWAIHWLLLRRGRTLPSGSRAGRQAVMLGLTVLAMLGIILALPVEPGTRQQLVSLFGLVLTAVIGLASTSFVSNLMAGLMLRAVRSFRPGDFVRVQDQFGRVTERGLFHTEIQTQDRDLVTLPNMFLISNPVTVVRASGTFVSCTFSLGYDIAHDQVEPLLQEAATDAELEDPFVRVEDLGNFSVTYRVAGFLTDVKRLLAVRSALRCKVLDRLHGAGVEIASPTIMIQRPLGEGEQIIPAPAAPAAAAPAAPQPEPESIIFDKAEEAERLESLRSEREALAEKVKELEKELGAAADDAKEALQRRVDREKHRLEALAEIIARSEDKDKEA